MAEDAFTRKLKNRRQISITVIGRRSGRSITLPVCFVWEENVLWLLPVYGLQTQWYRNLLVNPSITIRAGGQRRELRARVVKETRTVRKVIRWFQKKWPPDLVRQLYPGPLEVAVKVRLSAST